jgi:leucyl/phenylalanyl-tRNA--protein transferase
MRECAAGRSDGTWILSEMVEAYCELHRQGHAHSLEVFADGQLVAGIYGVQIGGLFAAESKFHRRRDLSKVALVALVRSLFRAGIELFDVQFRTDHLASLGAYELPRADYLERVRCAVERDVDLSGLAPRVD